MSELRQGLARSARATNTEIAHGYLAYLRDAKRRAPVTVYQYAAKLDDLLTFVGPRSLGGLDTDDLEAWLQRPRGGRAKGARGQDATIEKEVSILRGVYTYAMARGLVTRNPTTLLHAPTPKNRNPNPIDDAVWRKLWAHEGLTDEARLVLGLGYFCGLRRAEIANLTGSQVDMKSHRLIRFIRKGGGDDVLDYGELVGIYHDSDLSLMPDPSDFYKPLHAAVRSSDGGLLLNWGMTSPAAMRTHARPEGANDPQLIYKRVTRWVHDAGVEPFTPHQLRHSFVTNLLRFDVPLHLVSVLANHSSVSITMRYAKVGGQDLRELRRRRAAVASGLSRFQHYQAGR